MSVTVNVDPCHLYAAPQYGVHQPPTGDNTYEYASPDICMQHTFSAVTTRVFGRNK